jgi:N-methylhydantoinase B/oxoprolinase/acetone carboxylase alpha subunit
MLCARATTNTKNTPIETLERSYPMRVLRYRLRRGSAGAGSAPGGEGIEPDLLMLEGLTVSLITERLPDQCTIPLTAGDVVSMLTPGRGGWGQPPESV